MGNRRRTYSIRALLLVLVLGQIWVVLSLSAWMGSRASSQAVRDIREPLLDQVGQRVALRIGRLLDEPAIINELNAAAFRAGLLPLTEPLRAADYFYQQLVARPDISTVLVGLETNELVSLERQVEDGSIHQVTKAPGPPSPLMTAIIARDGSRTHLTHRDDYDTRGRPWYRAALEAGKPTWSPVYAFFLDEKKETEPRVTITAVRPFFDAQGAVLGVLASDLLLADIASYLRTIRIGNAEAGVLFIAQRDGKLVATSVEGRVAGGTNAKPELFRAVDFEHPLIQATARHIAARPGGFGDIDRPLTSEFELDDRVILVRAISIRQRGIDWLGVVAVPEKEFTGPIDENIRTTWMLFTALMLLTGLTISVFSRRVGGALRAVSDYMRQVADFDIPEEKPPPSAFSEIRVMQDSMAAMNGALRSFGRYVPKPVVRRLMLDRGEAVLGVEPAELTVMFSDIAGFTTFSESTPPDVLIEMMRMYFDAFADGIAESGGTVIEYIGDAVIAFWNAPVPLEDHPRRAVVATLACQARFDRLNADFAARGWPELETRIGVHVGVARVGNLGSPARLKYTALGDMMNLCARLESINKQYGTRVLVSGEVQRATAGRVVYRWVDTIIVKGRLTPTPIYEPLAPVEGADPAVRARAERHDAAMRLYTAGDFAAARAAFDRIVQASPGDGAARLLRDRCARYEVDPPPEGWDGAYAWQQK